MTRQRDLLDRIYRPDDQPYRDRDFLGEYYDSVSGDSEPNEHQKRLFRAHLEQLRERDPAAYRQYMRETRRKNRAFNVALLVGVLGFIVASKAYGVDGGVSLFGAVGLTIAVSYYLKNA
jgi:hypothetical protein